jgi:hypothetical protein
MKRFLLPFLNVTAWMFAITLTSACHAEGIQTWEAIGGGAALGIALCLTKIWINFEP